MKILVLGKNGMLGHVVYNYFLEKKYEVYGTSRDKKDLYYDANENIQEINTIFSSIKPDIVINCIGILVQESESDKLIAVKINSLLPHYLDYLSNIYNFKLIHISTDCVFNGTIGDYKEDSYPDAKSFYGRSKALGEIINKKNITLRTSIIGPSINPNGVGLFQWFMNQQGNIIGYKNAIWTGITTLEMAKCIETAINNDLTGLHHVVNNYKISKFELLNLFKNVFNKQINIIEDTKFISNKTLIRTKQSFDFKIPNYEDMITEMRDWINNHQQIYLDRMKKYESNDNCRNKA